MDNYFNKLDKIVDWIDYSTKESISKKDFFFCLRWEFFASCPFTLKNHYWKNSKNVFYFKYNPERKTISFQEFLINGNPHNRKIEYK